MLNSPLPGAAAAGCAPPLAVSPAPVVSPSEMAQTHWAELVYCQHTTTTRNDQHSQECKPSTAMNSCDFDPKMNGFQN